jgi:DNA-binding response OmpR family regulator
MFINSILTFESMKILVVEDEPKVAAYLKKGLEESGYEIDLANDGLQGLEFVRKNAYDLVLLDLIMPHLNGIELSYKIKSISPNTPIIMLTALSSTEDKLDGFEAGADDYMVKPFEFRELLARIKAVSKRINASAEDDTESRLTAANLVLDLNKKIALRNEKRIELTAKEFSLLEFFMRNKNKVVSKDIITQKVWEIDFDPGTNVVEVYVNLLRKKIDKDFEPKLIHTRVGMGYIFGEE